MDQMQVLFLCSELAPLVKIGGLGDVAGALPGALKALPDGPDIRICLPLYESIRKMELNLAPIASFMIEHRSGPLHAEVFQGNINGIPTYFFNGPPIASSSEVYSGDDHQDGTKFIFFSLAVLELARILKWKPDIIHAQDWHTAPAIYKLKRIRERDDFYAQTKSLLTVHNLPYLGHGTEKAMLEFGLPASIGSTLPDWSNGLPLPQGLLAADRINTVSPGYAEEILTSEFGSGLETFLYTRREDLSGILNGLDLENWDPENDPELPVNFGVDTLNKRVDNKTHLQKEVGLEVNPQVPLLAIISRLDFQKGIDLLPDAIRSLDELDWQCVILGTGDPKLASLTQQLDNDYAQVAAITKYDASLARRIYGGSDIILVPSRYEPCGLTQMIGMRYGCIPLARSTGGLKDTIIDYHSKDGKKSNGFLFNEANSQSFAETIRRALVVYRDQRRWGGLQRRGMKMDFSWEQSAIKYLDLYRKMI